MYYEDFDDDYDEEKSENRTFYRYLFLALLIPTLAIGGLALFAHDSGRGSSNVEAHASNSSAFGINLFGSNDDTQRLKKAAMALENFTRIHPPNHMWRQAGVKVVDGRTVKMTVDVPYRNQAQTISTRMPRIKYNYLVLACPPDEAGLDQYMNSNDRLVVELTHNGQTIAEGTCPRHPFSL